MELFSRLGKEHERTYAVTLALETFVERLHDAPIDLHELIRFVTFFRGYSDGLHHALEEEVLLPQLALEGFNLEQGPLAHIRDQHREEARLLLEFEIAASAQAPWGDSEIKAIASNARAYAAFERQHMAEERQHLFPLAERELLAHHAAELKKACDRFERRREPRWNRAQLERLGDELVNAHRPETAK